MHLFSHETIIALVKLLGVLGVAGVIFSECGLLLGIIFPGDSLLFTAGFLASQGFITIGWLVLATVASAIVGNMCGYHIGTYFGAKIFSSKHSRFFKEEYLVKTHAFFARHGAAAVVLARFLPIVRTCVPLLAGVAKMDYGAFIRDSFIGGILWGAGVPLLGYFLGTVIPDADRYLLYIVGLIIVLSLLPTLWHIKKGAFGDKD